MKLYDRLKNIDFVVNLYRNYLFYKWKLASKINKRLPANSTYKRVFKKNIDWNNPQDLIEKIAWMELYSDTSIWTICADKFKVREYISDCGYGQYLPKLYGHWKNIDEIDFGRLPKSFILKSNNGCGTVIAIKDKNQIQISKIKTILKKWLSRPYGYSGGQYHYLRIEPCIIAEELLQNDEIGNRISPSSLIDYKIWCINGVPKFFFVAYNRKQFSLDIAYYDLNWEQHPEYIVETSHYKRGTADIPKPVNLELMLLICRKLSHPFKEVRIDFYEVSGKLFIGELTFSSGYGYFVKERYDYLGSEIGPLTTDRITIK